MLELGKANSVKPDQPAHEQADQGLGCSVRLICPNIKGKNSKNAIFHFIVFDKKIIVLLFVYVNICCGAYI